MKKFNSFCVRVILCLVLCHLVIFSNAQELRNTVASTYYKWPELLAANISESGKYVFYQVQNMPLNETTLFVKATNTNWEKRFIIKRPVAFNALTKEFAVFNVSDDSLCMIRLGTDEIKYFPGFSATRYFDNNYPLATKKNILYYFNGKYWVEIGNREDHFYDYNVIRNGTAIIFCDKVKNRGSVIYQWIEFNLKTATKRIVSTETNVQSSYIDNNLNKLAYIIRSTQGVMSDYKAVVIDLNTYKRTEISNSQKSTYISSIKSFNTSGDVLLLELKDTASPVIQESPMLLRVWSWKDPQSQREQMDNAHPRSYFASYSFTDGKFNQLTGLYSQRFVTSPFGIDNYALVMETEGDCSSNEVFGDNILPACKVQWYLVNVHNGNRTNIPKLPGGHPNQFQLSADEKYIVYFDWESNSYYSYNVEKQKAVNLTASVTPFFRPANEKYLLRGSRGIAGWDSRGRHVYVYDAFDIWKMDLSGMNGPLNLTKSYGIKNQTEFGFVDENGLSSEGTTLAVAFNKTNKDNGFFHIDLTGKSVPVRLTMGPYKYFMGSTGGGSMSRGFRPLKAKNANIFLVMRESSTQFPNWFVTKDFSHFRPLSDIHPEEKMEMSTRELITFTNSGGVQLCGILYRPRGFDPSKKYPIIFNYYDIVSNALNQFVKPEPLCEGCYINPPTFTDNGYLIFQPDLVYIVDYAGDAVVDALESAVRKLAELPYADTSRIGIQGCSWGGYETNYAATYSKYFKAACTSSGTSDAVTTFSNKILKQPYYNIHHQQLYRSKIWENPEAFLKGSLLYNANKVHTPILLMHTTIDDAVPFNEALQFYTCLRELQRPVWLLEYSGPQANHGLEDPAQAMDFSLRMMQFFNHYLKGMPAPKWMLEGIPATKASTDNGLELVSDSAKLTIQ